MRDRCCAKQLRRDIFIALMIKAFLITILIIGHKYFKKVDISDEHYPLFLEVVKEKQ